MIRPIYEVNWEKATDFVKQNYSENVTIYSTSPIVTGYYLQRDVNWLHPDKFSDISTNNTLFLFTCYDKINLEGLKILEEINSKYNLLKSIEDKIFIYGCKDLT